MKQSFDDVVCDHGEGIAVTSPSPLRKNSAGPQFWRSLILSFHLSPTDPCKVRLRRQHVCATVCAPLRLGGRSGSINELAFQVLEVSESEISFLGFNMNI